MTAPLFHFDSQFTHDGNLAAFSISAAQAGNRTATVTQAAVGTVTIRQIAPDGSMRTVMGTPFTTASGTQTINFTAGNYEIVLNRRLRIPDEVGHRFRNEVGH